MVPLTPVLDLPKPNTPKLTPTQHISSTGRRFRRCKGATSANLDGQVTEKVKRGFFPSQVVHGSTHFSFLAPSLASPSAGHLTRIFDFGNVPSLRCLPLLSINPTNTTHPPKYASTDRLSFGHLPPILISQTFHILFEFGLSLTDIPSFFLLLFFPQSGLWPTLSRPSAQTRHQSPGHQSAKPKSESPPTTDRWSTSEYYFQVLHFLGIATWSSLAQLSHSSSSSAT